MGAVAQEYTAASSAGGLDQAAEQYSATGSTISSGPVTTTVAGELVVGDCNGQGTITAGSGFTLVSATGDFVEYQVQPAAGAIAATCTETGSGGVAVVATFKP